MRKLGACALITIIALSAPAEAILQGLDLRTQLQYRSLELKSRDAAPSSSGGLSTTYSLGLRGPLTPWARLLSNLAVNSFANSDQFGKQQSSNTVFNLSSNERTYQMSMGYIKNQYRSIRQAGEGGFAITDGQDTNYDLNFFMEEPAYPTINFQLRRRTSLLDSGVSESQYRSSSWLAGAFYEAAPFRFSIDQSKQTMSNSGGVPGSATTNRTMAAHVDQKILNGLNFSGFVSKDSSSLAIPGRQGNSLSGSTKSLRLTATPTPAVVINADRYIRDSRQEFFGGVTSGRTDGETLSVRAEALPGLSLNMAKSRSTQTGFGRDVGSDNLSAGINAVLTPDTLLNVSWLRLKQRGDSQGNSTSSTTATLQLPPLAGLDMSIDGGFSNSGVNLGQPTKSVFAGITLRGSVSSDATFGLSYRRNRFSSFALQTNNQTTDYLDLNFSWIANSTIGINGRLNYYLNGGSNVSEYIAPHIDLRWTPNATSSLFLSYDLSKSRQWDWVRHAFLDQGDKGLSLRFSHQLSRGSSLDLLYDFQGADQGSLESQRSLQVYFSHRL